MFDFPAIGRWRDEKVTTRWVQSTRPNEPEIEQTIEEEWAHAAQRKRIHLFDGPMCRLEAFAATDDALALTLSPTSYKPFVGTNLTHAHFADRFGSSALANPIGLSAVVISADGFALLGVRSQRVAYYPSRIHPFSGSLEPGAAIDVFAEILRELREELSLTPDAIDSILCLGIASDRSIRQPELIFITRVRLTRANLETQLDAEEHAALWAAKFDPLTLVPSDFRAFTPVGLAALLLAGREQFGTRLV